MGRLFGIIGLLMLAIGMAWAQGERPAPPWCVRGTVTYREKIALTPDAVVNVALLDVTTPEAFGIVIGEQRIVDPGLVPVQFRVCAEAKTNLPDHRYAVMAYITEADNRIQFVTPAPVPYDPRLREQRPVELVLQMPPTLPSFGSVEGRWQVGDTASGVRGYFNERQIKFIEEEQSWFDYGGSFLTYSYDNGVLLSIHERRQAVDTEVRPPARREVDIMLLYNPQGTLVVGHQLVNDKPVEVTAEEAEVHYRHARTLELLAIQGLMTVKR